MLVGKHYYFDRSYKNELGRGGYGVVYKGDDKRNNNAVAVKEMKKENLNMTNVERENEIIMLLKSIKNENIVTHYHTESTDTYIFMVMELCDYNDLESYYNKHKIVDRSNMNIILRQLANGLQLLHSNNIIHRDLKPKNILLHKNKNIENPLMNDLTLKIADFGTSRFISNSALATTAVVGTLSYMAPELYTQEAYDHKADVWSVGLIAYKGLFGKLPEILIRDQFSYINFWNDLNNRKVEPKIEFPFCWNLISVLRKSLIRDVTSRMAMPNFLNLIFKLTEKHFHNAKMENFGIEFAQDIIHELQLHHFLTAKDERQIFILVTEYNTLSAIKLSQVLQSTTEYKEDDSYIFIRFNSLLQERVIEAFKSESNNLIIIECEESIKEQGIQRQLSQIINANNNKKIVLITKQDNALADLFKKYPKKYQETADNKNSFTHLTTASQQKLLQECKIILQGCEISLNQLIDENSKELIDSATLVKLINRDEVIIGHELISLGDTQNYYIPRTFNYQTVIKTEIFKEKKYLLAISDIDEARLRRLVPEDHKFCSFQEYGLDNNIRSIILNDGQAAEQFQQLCQRYPALNIHWLKSESDQLIWQQSQGSMSGLHQYIDESHTKHYSETELSSQTDKVMIISETAGMGKTTVLTRLSQLFKQQFPDLWIVRIDLSNFTRELQEQKVKSSLKTEDQAIAFLSNDILKLGTPLEQALFKSYCQGMIVMLDGFDEISPDYRDTVIDLVNVLRNSTIKQLWVTTRPNERDILEDKLQQISYKLEPFSKPNQVEFLTKFWQQTSGLSEVTRKHQEWLKDYAGALIDLLTKSIKYKDTELTGIPLQTRMLAEAFDQNFAEYFKTKEAKLQLPEKLDLTDLYECFFKKKYDIQLEKSKLDISQPNKTARSETKYSQFIEEHQNLALYTLFPEGKVEVLLCEKFYQEFSKEYPDLAPIVLHDENSKQLLFKNKKQKILSFIDDIKEGKANTGIIDQIIEDKPHFIHRTFAEYLVGKFLVTSLDNETIVEFVLQEILMQPAYQVTRAFLNGQLPESLPEDTLARYGKQIGRLWQSDKTNRYNKEGKTLLHVAAEEGTVQIIGFLLNSLKGHETILKSLLKATTTNYIKETALHLAAAGGYLDAVQSLVEHGADVNVKSTRQSPWQPKTESALHWAAQGNKWDVVQWLVEHGKANVEAADNIGMTVLHCAAQGNKLDVVQWLVEHGKANVEATNMYGMTVLHCAAKGNKLDVVQWLVEHRKANVEAADNDGMTVLHYAARWNKSDVVQWLVEHGKANVETTNKYGMTVLDYAARGNKWDVVQWLVEHGADVNATDIDGLTVLHLAAGGNLNIFQWLVEHGADVNATNFGGKTPLNLAEERNTHKNH